MIIAVIPAYNEAKRIKGVILKTSKYVDRVIVVDDGSTDNTFAVAKRYADIVLKNIINMGKGFALRVGFEAAIKEKASLIVMLDADGQHDASEIPVFLRELKKSDFVIGERDFSKMHFRARCANMLLSAVFRILFGMDIGDSQSGFRAVNSKIYGKIKWDTNKYGVETEMLANAARNKVIYSEVPIATIYHEVYKGTSFIDGIKIALLMLKWRFFRW